jgi:anti-sigma regulatory factor (Ser/Thr protein kinase)
MESDPIHLQVRSHPQNLKQIRSLMTDIVSKTSLSQDDLGSLILAVDEACSNIIKHSYKNDHTQNIDLTIQVKTDSLVISIIDYGTKLDISSMRSRDINDIRPGGLGIYIIKKVMDSLEYTHTKEGYNEVIMIKKF